MDQIVTYVNPVCVEKLNDDGSLKFRTRLTIGGDRIIYPYDKSAVTADLESFKILLNFMISENANWTTIDQTDFYLGTPPPHPEYIQIPISMIPERVCKFYNLTEYISSNNTLLQNDGIVIVLISYLINTTIVNSLHNKYTVISNKIYL